MNKYSHTRYRQSLYKQGGLISVTSRILVVDMLQGDIPIELVTGMIVMHAEKYVSICCSCSPLTVYQGNLAVTRGFYYKTI